MAVRELDAVAELHRTSLMALCAKQGHVVFGRTYPDGLVDLTCLRCGLNVQLKTRVDEAEVQVRGPEVTV